MVSPEVCFAESYPPLIYWVRSLVKKEKQVNIPVGFGSYGGDAYRNLDVLCMRGLGLRPKLTCSRSEESGHQENQSGLRNRSFYFSLFS